MDQSVKNHMVEARNQLREVMGIPLAVPTQVVVNAMLQLADDLFAGDRTDALRVLSSPTFSQPPERTLYLLSNLPYVREANLATTRAEQQSFST